MALGATLTLIDSGSAADSMSDSVAPTHWIASDIVRGSSSLTKTWPVASMNTASDVARESSMLERI